MSDLPEQPKLKVKPIPGHVKQELQSSSTNGHPPWNFHKSDGRTLFDTLHSHDNTIHVIFPQEKFESWRSQALAHIHSSDNRLYLCQVIKGPYAAPNGLPANSPMLLATQVEGAVFTPPYHGWVELTILGEVKDKKTIPNFYRPRPNSPVRLLSPRETKEALDCDGDLRFGRALGQPELYVGLRSGEKHHIPRHTLVVGTTGAGKSTSLVAFVEKLAANGFCVVIIDVESEYTFINEPADSPNILPALNNLEIQPAGVPETYLLVPTDSPTANPSHPKIRRFCLDFSNISPFIASELLQGTDAQTDRFQAAYDAAGELITQLKAVPNYDLHQGELQVWDDQESGYPDLRLAHVLDMAEAVAAVAGGEEKVDEKFLHSNGFANYQDQLMAKAQQVKKRIGHKLSWLKTVSLIGSLHRSGLFDLHKRGGKAKPRIDALDYQKMIAPGRILIFDMQGIDSPRHRNLAISDLLRGVTQAQDKLYAKAEKAKQANAKNRQEANYPKTVILVEEAHEFVSLERIKQMPTVFNQIQRIARRGRKRWLGLIFATQFPQHLPSELFTLCNNRIIMRLGDEPTINRLKNSIGGVPDSLWHRVKNLPSGQAIVSAHGIDPAMLVALEPGKCKLRLAD